MGCLPVSRSATLGGYSFSNPVLFAAFDTTGTRILTNSATEAVLWKGNGDFVRQLDLATGMRECRNAGMPGNAGMPECGMPEN